MTIGYLRPWRAPWTQGLRRGVKPAVQRNEFSYITRHERGVHLSMPRAPYVYTQKEPLKGSKSHGLLTPEETATRQETFETQLTRTTVHKHSSYESDALVLRLGRLNL